MWCSRQQQQSQQQHTVWRVIRIRLKSTCGGSRCQCYLGQQKSDICQQRFGCKRRRKVTPEYKQAVRKTASARRACARIPKRPSRGRSTRTSSRRGLSEARDIYMVRPDSSGKAYFGLIVAKAFTSPNSRSNLCLVKPIATTGSPEVPRGP